MKIIRCALKKNSSKKGITRYQTKDQASIQYNVLNRYYNNEIKLYITYS